VGPRPARAPWTGRVTLRGVRRYSLEDLSVSGEGDLLGRVLVEQVLVAEAVVGRQRGDEPAEIERTKRVAYRFDGMKALRLRTRTFYRVRE
jgi:hypothetical protein